MTKLGVASKRFSSSMQATLIRVYKGIGLLALIGILVGLVGFLTINVYYLFDNSWIRPVILSPSHEKVVQAQSAMAEETYRRDQLAVQSDELKLELAVLDRTIELSQRFADDLEQVEAAIGAGGYDALMARRERDQSVLEREKALQRKSSIEQRLALLEQGITRHDRVIGQIRRSPYLAAADRQITVAFVPYENLHNIEKDAPVFGCEWGLVRCRKVGRVVSRIDGEVIDEHPHSNTALRGIMVQIDLREAWAGQERALFVGSRPFWIF